MRFESYNNVVDENSDVLRVEILLVFLGFSKYFFKSLIKLQHKGRAD